jgi:hypothetical protein
VLETPLKKALSDTSNVVLETPLKKALSDTSNVVLEDENDEGQKPSGLLKLIENSQPTAVITSDGGGSGVVSNNSDDDGDGTLSSLHLNNVAIDLSPQSRGGGGGGGGDDDDDNVLHDTDTTTTVVDNDKSEIADTTTTITVSKECDGEIHSTENVSSCDNNTNVAERHMDIYDEMKKEPSKRDDDDDSNFAGEDENNTSGDVSKENNCGSGSHDDSSKSNENYDHSGTVVNVGGTTALRDDMSDCSRFLNFHNSSSLAQQLQLPATLTSSFPPNIEIPHPSSVGLDSDIDTKSSLRIAIYTLNKISANIPNISYTNLCHWILPDHLSFITDSNLPAQVLEDNHLTILNSVAIMIYKDDADLSPPIDVIFDYDINGDPMLAMWCQGMIANMAPIQLTRNTHQTVYKSFFYQLYKRFFCADSSTNRQVHKILSDYLDDLDSAILEYIVGSLSIILRFLVRHLFFKIFIFSCPFPYLC